MRNLSRRGIVRAARRIVPVAVLAMGVAGAVAPQPARAQFFGWGNDAGWGGQDRGDWGRMDPGQIYHAIGQQGFRVIAPLRRNGDVFVAEVIDRQGRHERLIVSASNAEILQRFVFSGARRARNAGLLPDDDQGRALREDLPPVPPGSIPNAGDPNRQYGTFDEVTPIEPTRPRAPQRQKPARPKLVERTSDGVQPEAEPGVPGQPTRLKSRPSEAARLPGASSDRPSEPTALTATRPAEPAARPVAAAASPSPAASAASPSPAAAAAQPAPAGPAPSGRMRDPLAIPRAEPKTAEAPKTNAAPAEPRIISTAITGSPVRKPASPPAKTGDVPVAPLD